MHSDRLKLVGNVILKSQSALPSQDSYTKFVYDIGFESYHFYYIKIMLKHALQGKKETLEQKDVLINAKKEWCEMKILNVSK